MKKEMSRDCAALRKGKGHSIETIRGLEKYAEPQKWEKRSSRKDTALNVVLTQQMRCRRFAEADLAIAAVYQVVSRHCRAEALERGRQDEAEVAQQHEALRKQLAKELRRAAPSTRRGFGGLRKFVNRARA